MDTNRVMHICDGWITVLEFSVDVRHVKFENVLCVFNLSRISMYEEVEKYCESANPALPVWCIVFNELHGIILFKLYCNIGLLTYILAIWSMKQLEN